MCTGNRDGRGTVVDAHWAVEGDASIPSAVGAPLRVPWQAMGYLGLALLFVLFVLALLPTRRLWVAGARLEWRIAYLVTLVVLGLAAIEFEAFGRYLLPLLLLLYLVPFSGLLAWWERSRRRAGRDTIIEGRAVRLDPDEPPRR